MKTIVSSLRFEPESKLKLKLLCVALDRTMADVLASAINDYWEKHENITNSSLTSRKAAKEINNLLEKLLKQ